MKREFKVELIEDKKKELFMVLPIWKKYGTFYVPLNSTYQPTECATLEEAQKEILNPKMKWNGLFAIVKCYGIYEGKNRPVDIANMVKRKFAVFCKNRVYDYTINQRRNEIVWCGVLEGYDSQDILGRLNPYYHRKKDASIWAMKDGKIMNKDKLGEMLRTAQKITPEWKREKTDDRCFNNDFEKIDLKELM